MKTLPFPPLSRDLSRLALGSMVFHPDTPDASFELMDVWRELGGNTIDSAHIYQGGHSERIIGAYHTARNCRKELVILTKGAHHNADRKRLWPEDIASDLRDSLARLKTDYVDLYVLHRDDPEVPVGEIIDALNGHKQAGRILAFGGSNWTTRRLDEANAYAAAHGLEGMSCSSPHLSLAVPNGEIWADCIDARDAASLAWYRCTQMPLFAWSSQARGFFSGRFTPENTENETITRVYYSEGNWERLRRTDQLGAERGFSAIQVALAWVLHQPFPVFPLVGPANAEEMRSCVRALDLELSPGDMAWLDLR
jgi:aryl-alcohol dehydrogenase-like predicted oxidoreductase